MIIRTAIRLENTDMADIKRMHDAFNLVGGEHSREAPPKTHGRATTHPDHKPFNHIFANDFTKENVLDALAFIYLRKIELDASAAEIEPDMPGMADGIRSNANLAVRLAEEFLANLEEDLNDDLIDKEKGPERSLRSCLHRL